MKVYDISQEILSCKVYPGDPHPTVEPIMHISDNKLYNLSAFRMCVHNGTHIDSPFHFFADGKTVDKIPLEQFVGMAYVARHKGFVTSEDAIIILKKAEMLGNGCEKRILIKGEAEVSLETAQIFANANILLLGNESQTIGPINVPLAVHKVLLSKDVVLLEGIRLQDVSERSYLLNALPLNLEGLDGSPCRAILMEL